MTKDLGDNKIFLENLKKRREKLCLSRLQAAKKLGCSDTYVTNIENGEKVPAYNFLVKLAEAYGEDPIEYMLWRAQRKEEYDMHSWLKQVRSLLGRIVIMSPPVEQDQMAAEPSAEYEETK